MTDTFQRNIAISLGLHFAIAMLLMFRAILIPSEPLAIRDAIRVDMVGLPEKMTEPPKLTEPPSKAAEEKPKDMPKKAEAAPPKPAAPTVPSKTAKKADTKKSELSALNKLKAQSAIEKIKEDLKKEKAAKAGTVVKGNQVSKGNSLTGLEKIEYDRYFDDLKGKLLDHFNIPQWLADGKFRAQVQVLIDERGYVIKKILRKSSGNEIFDSKALEAVENSSPFPPPPKRLQGALQANGIIFNFPE